MLAERLYLVEGVPGTGKTTLALQFLAEGARSGAPVQYIALLKHLFPASKQVGKVSDVIERQVTHLTRLVDDLLDVARITSGKVLLQRKEFKLQQVLDHVSELCQPAASKRHISIAHDMPTQAVMLHADYARMVQIFANIVSNAVKFRPDGGHIHISARQAQGQLQVAVEDNGIGIEPDAIARIFSMFEQGRTLAGQMTSGLGIGLSLARQLAELHGGGIDAYSCRERAARQRAPARASTGGGRQPRCGRFIAKPVPARGLCRQGRVWRRAGAGGRRYGVTTTGRDGPGDAGHGWL
ncbi:ATP-binding protein [Janthinobacterium sp. RB2P8]|uniref:sensor histidine kinase n=1 Tax=Janthinobacterium sp. RB2P8 TaxID=3424191 RepID=UPI003F27A229